MHRSFHLLIALVLAWALTACSEVVAFDLSQKQALETVIQLQIENINARHIANDGGSWNVQVPRKERVRATAIILDRNLLPSPAPEESISRAATFDPSSAIRKHELDRSRLIESNLQKVPGVRSASITLSLCESSARSGNTCDSPNRLSALVLLNPNAEPPDEDALKAWLAASAPALKPENVELVLSWATGVAQTTAKPSSVPSLLSVPKEPFFALGAVATLLTASLLAVAVRVRSKQHSHTALHDLSTGEA